MNHTTITEEAEAAPCKRSRTAKLIAAPTLAVGVGTFLAGAASAAPPEPEDPMGGAMTDVVADVQEWVTTYGIPAVLVAITFGIIVRIGFKWVRRAGRSVG